MAFLTGTKFLCMVLLAVWANLNWEIGGSDALRKNFILLGESACEVHVTHLSYSSPFLMRGIGRDDESLCCVFDAPCDVVLDNLSPPVPRWSSV